MKPLNSAELKTLLAMARCCQSIIDAQDTLFLYSLLAEPHKKQLKRSIKALPIATKRLLRDAASQPHTGEVAA